MGTREKAAGLDFSGVLPEEVEAELKDAAMISMGTEISVEDLDNIQALADQVRGWGWGSTCGTGSTGSGIRRMPGARPLHVPCCSINCPQQHSL